MNEPEILDSDLGEPMPSRPTKRDLIERGADALDMSEMSPVKISAIAGGVSFATVIEVMDFAKMMAISGKLVPKYLRGNPGGCLGITFQAIEWRMSPFQVANKSYEVNDRVAYESQLIHAVVEARAPLQHRLDCEYQGEGGERVCIVRGMFTNGDVREYESPKLKDVRVKNSPLWKDDPDQQLFYYASRSWARKWVPDVLMGIYSREELQDRPDLGREGDEASGLQARLTGSERAVTGYNGGQTASELAAMALGIDYKEPRAQADQPVQTSEGVETVTTTPKRKKRATDVPSPSDDIQQADTVDEDEPGTVTAYRDYARKWIKGAKTLDALRERWTRERALRNKIGMTADERKPLEDMILKRRKEWEA